MIKATGALDGTQTDLMSVIAGYIRSVSEKAEQTEIRPESLLLEDLYLDSLDLVRIVMHLEDHYHVSVDLDEVSDMRRVADLAATVSRQVRTAA